MNETICFIGIGNMGSSIIDFIISKNLWKKDKLILCDYEYNKLNKYKNIEDLCLIEDASEAVCHSKNIVIAVKPQDAPCLFEQIKSKITPESLIISIMAGVKINVIQKYTGCKAVIRCMPNLPVKLGKGVIGWSCSNEVDEKRKKFFSYFCRYFGKALYFADEASLDAITALSGSGPMYVALFTQSLIKAGELIGLNENEAKIAAIQTLIGSALMLEQLSMPTELLIQKITSKGGTTEQASKIFHEYDFANIIIKAVQAAYSKARTLGKE